MKKIKYIVAITILLFVMNSYGQVGIGTIAPAATLDVIAANPAGIGTTVDGILIPRVTRQRAQSMSGTPTSTIIYVTEVATGSAFGTTINVTAIGFYFFDGLVWVLFNTGPAAGWLTTGNAGLNVTNNFIGTTDGVDVAFRRNNSAAGRIANTATSFGIGALNAAPTSTNNTAFGNNAALSTTGARNVAVGVSSLQANILGVENVAIGNQALLGNTNSLRNTAMGHRAMASLNGSANVDNVAIGWQSMADAAAGIRNTFIGVQAGRLATGNFSTAIGYQALGSNNGTASSGIDNVAIGSQALCFNNAGQQNTAIGVEAMSRTTASSNSTAVGYAALRNFEGAQNTAVGYQAGQGSASSTGVNNIFMGYQAGFRAESGSSNVLIGTRAGDNVTTGNVNTFIGQDAGNFTTTGSFNIGIGPNAGNANTTASNNINIGFQTGNSNIGNNNVNIGHQAGFLNTLGGNVNIGYQAGVAETTANKLYITNSATTSSTSLIYGDFSGTRILRTNSTFQIGDPAGTGYVFPIARGTTNQILQTDGVGLMSWVNPTVKPYVTTGAAVGIYTIVLTEYTVRVFNGVSEVRLPNAIGNTGKVYVIIGSNGISSKILSTSGGVIYDDVTNTVIATINTNERLMVQSDGTDWIVIGR